MENKNMALGMHTALDSTTGTASGPFGQAAGTHGDKSTMNTVMGTDLKYFTLSIEDIGTKLIGIKKRDKNGTNIGIIWEKRDDGKWYCESKNYVLEQWQINHDYSLGYLKLYNNG